MSIHGSLMLYWYEFLEICNGKGEKIYKKEKCFIDIHLDRLLVWKNKRRIKYQNILSLLSLLSIVSEWKSIFLEAGELLRHRWSYQWDSTSSSGAISRPNTSGRESCVLNSVIASQVFPAFLDVTLYKRSAYQEMFPTGPNYLKTTKIKVLE